jgi:hypothetical protein
MHQNWYRISFTFKGNLTQSCDGQCYLHCTYHGLGLTPYL